MAQPLERGQEAGAPQTEGYDLPLVKLEEFVPRGNVGTEFTRGVLSAGSGLTTPSSAALLGSVGAANRLGSQVLSRLISAGFAADMAHALYEQVGAFREAVDAGDYQAAANLAGQATATGLFTAGATHHALQPGGWIGKERRAINVKENIQGLPSEERIRQEPVEAQLVERPGREEARPGGVLQTEREVIPAPPPGFVIERPDVPDSIKAEPVAPAPSVPKRAGPKLAVLGEAPDLLNTIDQLGGLRPRPGKGSVYDEANYDGWDEVMRQGPARLLARKSGLAPDDMRQALGNAGLPFESTSELYAAIGQALESRQAMKGQLAEDRANQVFSEAAYENKGKSAPQKSSETLTVSSLKIGDRFKIKGEPFEVTDISGDGEVTVQDGRKFPPQTLLDGESIFPDRKSVELGAEDVRFEPDRAELREPVTVDAMRRKYGEEPTGPGLFEAPAPRAERKLDAGERQRAQQLENGISEGELRLRSKVNSLGEKLSAAELQAVARSVENAKAELASLKESPISIADFPQALPKELQQRGISGMTLKDLGALPIEDTGRVSKLRESFEKQGDKPEGFAAKRGGGLPALSLQPDGKIILINGRHRLEAARQAGLTELTFEIKKYDSKGNLVRDIVAPVPIGKSELSAKTEPTVTMESVAKGMAEVGERSRGEAANEIVGQLGMKAAGPPKSAGSLEGSPLFGSSQKGLFGDERGFLNLVGSERPIDYSGIDDAKPRTARDVMSAAKERTASWFDRTIRRTTDRFVDLRRLVERAEEQDLLKSNPDFKRWQKIDEDILRVEQEIGDLEGSSRAVTRRGGMRETASIPLTRADADRLQTLRTERARLQTESETLGKRLSGNPFQKLARELATRRSAAEISADVDPAKQAQIAYGGGLGRAQLGMMDYGDVFRDARKEGVEDGLRVYLRLAAKERGISVVEEKLADRKKTMAELGPKLKDLNGQIAGLEADLKTRRHIQNVPTAERRVTRANELKLEALKKLRNDVESDLRDASFEADRFQRLLDQRQAVPDNDTHQTLAAKMEQLKARAPEKFAAIETAAKRVFALNRKALELAYEEGLISEEAYNKWTARGDAYVPLTRLIEEAAIDHGEGPKPGTFQAKQQFQPLEGGSRELEDPLRASMDRFQSIVKQVEKNRVVKNIVTWMSQHRDLAEARQLEKDEKAGAQEGELAFYFDGKLQRFAVDKTLADVLTMSPPHIADFTGGALIQFASSVAKAGITGVNLAFSIPNVVRDVKTLAMTSKSGVRNPLKHPGDLGRLIKLWVESLRKQSNQDPHFREFLESGAAFSTLQSNLTPEYFTRMKRTTSFNPLYWAAQVNQRMEQATKVAAFRTARERGMSTAEAAWETRNFGGSPDFGRRGTQGAVWNALFLYFNARMQGTLQTIKGGTRDPMRLGTMLAAYTAAALALQAWNNRFEDEEGNKEFDRVSDHERQQYQVILLPGTEQKADGSVRHQVVKIPKSHFEQLWFNPVQETIARLFGGKIDLAQTGLDFASNLTPLSGNIRRGSVARDVVLGGVSSLNPLLKETVEQFSNFDAYRQRPIVPERLKRVDPRYQYNQSTAEISKRVGQAAGLSPLRLEHAARTFGGGTAEALLGVGDVFLKDTARQPREGQEKLTRLPVVGAILRRFIGTSGDQVEQRRMDGFYAMKAKADQVQATYRDRAKANPVEARRYLDEEPSHRKLLAPAVRKRIHSIGEALGRIHTQARQVAESRLPDAAKKEKARELARLEGNILAQAERLAQQVGVTAVTEVSR